ncbi:MAG: aspartoacylase [Leptolyngbyaceae cyanobacterium MO_188.B28]|nr:aspartoacylase [Leptolyngbyaceae cyanobacterium MO_188.B28]
MGETKKLNRVLLVGGTHGNEFIGIFLIKKFQQFPHLIARSSFETQTLLGNPKAFKANMRYIDKDLNRCFAQHFSEEEDLIAYEDIRAREIHQQFGSSGETPADVVVDLHSSTANMGLTLIIDRDDAFTLQLAAYLSSVNPSIKIYHSGDSGRSEDSFRSLGKLGVAVEVGPISQGVLKAELFLKTEALIHEILNFLEKFNQGEVLFFNQELTVYRYVKTIDYPRNKSGEIQAMIHPHLQFRDYHPLHPDDPMFLSFDGTVISYEDASTTHPIFINEAAYYEKGIAMSLTKKQQLPIHVEDDHQINVGNFL